MTAGGTERQRVAILTGASRGLGLALASALSKRGWRLAVDARSDAALAQLDQVHGVTWLAGDVADDSHRRALIATVGDRLDLLVNNASMLGPSPRPGLAEYPVTELARVFEVNVFAPLALAQLALPLFEPGGVIVNVSSDAAREPYPGWGGYGSSKAALDQLTAVLAAEQPQLGVYSFDPGDMRTELQQQAFPDEDISDRPPPEQSIPALLELIDGRLPSGRYVAAELQAALA